MYAVVKAGGKQHKVAVGDVVEVNRVEGEAGDEISLPALLLVDGRNVVSETAALAKIAVTGEIVGHHKGPKIKILKYKNKTGYRKRIGHRQLLTELLVTDIDDGKPKKKAKADTAKADTAKAKASKADTAKAKASTAETDDKPSKTAKAATAAPAKAEADDKPSKTAKATSADAAQKAVKAADKPEKASKATKANKATKATASSKSSESTDNKKKED